MATMDGGGMEDLSDGVNKLTQQVSKVTAPKVAQKLEQLINTRIGDTVHIPLKLPVTMGS